MSTAAVSSGEGRIKLATAMTQQQVLDLVTKQLMPAFLIEREKLTHLDKWMRWEHDDPHRPPQATREYLELGNRAQTPWLSLVVSAVVQSLYVDGYRATNSVDDATPWSYWQANGLDRRQIGVHRAATGYGHAYVTVLPGTDDFGGSMPVIRGVSPRRMTAFYDEPENDDWPHFAMKADPIRFGSGLSGSSGWALQVYDDFAVYYLQSGVYGEGLTFMEWREHGVGVCPVVKFANLSDLEGRCDGEVEPFIPVAGRIDQTTFDRLVVQRFSSWVVRTIAGMAKPETADMAQAEKLRLKVEDILVAEDKDTKFGSLPATQLDGFISAWKADVGALAAVSQTPAHEMLGTLANLSAEALAAARASLTAKVEERKTSHGESWEQVLRLAAWVMGDITAAQDTSAQVRWRDTEIRSLAQAADALGKLAQMLQVPVELLWEKIPGFTQQDVERAATLVAQGGTLEQILQQLVNGQTSPPTTSPPPSPPVP